MIPHNIIPGICPSGAIRFRAYSELSILPSGRVPVSPLRQRIIATNQLLAERAERKPMTCQFLNVHDIFIESDQRWVKGLTLDGTHLSLNGYDKLAQVIRPFVKARLKTTPSK